MKQFLCVTALMMGIAALGEQSVELGDYTVHYSVIPSTLIPKETAERHGIVRGKNRALCNITVIDSEGDPYETEVTGEFKNLMGQSTKLKFKVIKEAEAVYSLASFKYTDGENLKFDITVELPDGKESFKFEQKVYSNVDGTSEK